MGDCGPGVGYPFRDAIPTREHGLHMNNVGQNRNGLTLCLTSPLYHQCSLYDNLCAHRAESLQRSTGCNEDKMTIVTILA